jgi:hypothetical protein
MNRVTPLNAFSRAASLSPPVANDACIDNICCVASFNICGLIKIATELKMDKAATKILTNAFTLTKSFKKGLHLVCLMMALFKKVNDEKIYNATQAIKKILSNSMGLLNATRIPKRAIMANKPPKGKRI